MRIDSGSAVLDIKRGRRLLTSRLTLYPNQGIPVTIKGFLVQVGNDDGESTEFIVDVTGVEVNP